MNLARAADSCSPFTLKLSRFGFSFETFSDRVLGETFGLTIITEQGTDAMPSPRTGLTACPYAKDVPTSLTGKVFVLRAEGYSASLMFIVRSTRQFHWHSPDSEAFQ